MISPLVPVPADEANPNGGFIREPGRPAVMALVQSVVDGDPTTGGRGLRGRAAGVNMFEVSYHNHLYTCPKRTFSWWLDIGKAYNDRHT